MTAPVVRLWRVRIEGRTVLAWFVWSERWRLWDAVVEQLSPGDRVFAQDAAGEEDERLLGVFSRP